MKRIGSLALLLGVAVLAAACGPEAENDITGPMGTARVKFFNFGVGAPSVNFFANDTKVTAVSSGLCTPLPTDETLRQQCLTDGREATTGVAYGGAGIGGLYAGLQPGQYTVQGKISATTDKELTIAKVATTLADGKAYSFYISGIYDATAKTADAFVIEDNLPAKIDFANATVRFVNAIPNSPPLSLVVKSATGDIAVGGATAYQAGTAWVTIPNGGLVDLVLNAQGSATPVVTRTQVSLSASRTYTITARGDYVSTVTANKPALDVTANR